jgi:hypothetical protein
MERLGEFNITNDEKHDNFDNSPGFKNPPSGGFSTGNALRVRCPRVFAILSFREIEDFFVLYLFRQFDSRDGEYQVEIFDLGLTTLSRTSGFNLFLLS